MLRDVLEATYSPPLLIFRSRFSLKPKVSGEVTVQTFPHYKKKSSFLTKLLFLWKFCLSDLNVNFNSGPLSVEAAEPTSFLSPLRLRSRVGSGSTHEGQTGDAQNQDGLQQNKHSCISSSSKGKAAAVAVMKITEAEEGSSHWLRGSRASPR